MNIKDSAVLNSLMSSFSVNFENLLNLPCYVFYKNIMGDYLGYNDYGANNLGYDSGKEIAGKSDHEIFPHEMATLYRTNDIDAIKKNKQIFASERGIIKNETPVIFLSYKMPLYHQDEVVGVLGISFTRSVNDRLSDISEDFSSDKLAEFCNYPKINSDSLLLSGKEKECLRYLCQGLTVKMIARRLTVSPKTVETYIERAKNKMGCHNKAELILTFIKTFGDL